MAGRPRPRLIRGEPLGVPAARIVFPAADRAEIAAAVSEILGTGSLTLGPYTRQFEAAFAAAHGARHAAATASGTAALDIALRVAGVQGREVIVPANTFFATAAAVAAAGGTPGIRGHRPGHVRAQPADRGRGADPGHGRRGAGAHRRADQPAGRRAWPSCARSAGSP